MDVVLRSLPMATRLRMANYSGFLVIEYEGRATENRRADLESIHI